VSAGEQRTERSAPAGADEALYQQAIVTAARAATGAGRLPAADGTATVDNPLCGDRVTIDLALAGDRVSAVGQVVRGCILCEAAASIIAACAPGEPAAALPGLRRLVEAMLRERAEAPAGRWQALAAFRPVAAHKSRHECVLLPFEALSEALGHARGGDR